MDKKIAKLLEKIQEKVIAYDIRCPICGHDHVVEGDVEEFKKILEEYYSIGLKMGIW